MKWGSCNREGGDIRLNTDLAKKPPECLDHVVVHELAHLREGAHSATFFTMLDRAMPSWRQARRLLDDLPLRAV